MAIFANEAKITLKPGNIKFQQGAAQVQIGGQIQWDHDRFDGVHNVGKVAKRGEIPRARIYFKGALSQYWEGKLQLHWNDDTDEIQLKDIYLKYTDRNRFGFTFGKHKEPFGLEVLNSSKHLSSIERAMPSIAFAPSRNYGLMVFGSGRKATVAAGVYIEDQDEEDKQETYAWTGRVTYTPIKKKNALIHLGLAGSFRDLAGNNYQVKKRAEVHQASKIIESAIIKADNLTLLGLEAATVLGPFSVQSEYMGTSIEADDHLTHLNADYEGYYIQADYLLTGESRSYKKGHFSQVKPHSPYGAWQLVTRFSHIDVDDNNEGVEAENITLGINYYANLQLRVSANYIMTELEGSDVNPDEDNAKALSFRFQYLF